MAQTDNEGPPATDMPTADIQSRRSFSLVWLIPLIAALIGGWLAYKAFSEKGPTVTITFKTAEGLEAGKTKIKYKDVEVGVVEAIRLSRDLSKVVVTAELVKGTERYLTDRARFWVVRARVAAGKVSGLGTLFSGAYIALDPGRGGSPIKSFTGLETAPIVTADQAGRRFRLRADSLGSLDIGSPVYFRRIEVGQVAGYELDDDGRAVTIQIFIDAPHHEKVRRTTRFWNAGGIDVTVDANGLQLDTQSVVSLLIGGIAFETPEEDPGDTVEEDAEFPLFQSRQDSLQKVYVEKNKWVLNFEDSVRGLAPGAPVEFRGIQVGQVIDVRLQFDTDRKQFRIPVLVEFEPERIEMIGSAPEVLNRRKLMDGFVAQGLRAQLKTGNLLTGQLFIDLDLHPDATPAEINWDGKYPELPTVQAPLEEIAATLTRVARKLEKVPFQEVGADLRAAVEGLNQTLNEAHRLLKNLDANLAPELAATLREAQKAMAAAEALLSADSPLTYEGRRALSELAETARSVRALTDYLQRHPEALIFGKETAP